MRYIPHTDRDIEEMLACIGVESLEDLFSDIANCCPAASPLELSSPLPERALLKHLEDLSNRNIRPLQFLGAGCYEHPPAAAVDALLMRGELFTAYTPYQPEISQGTLQAIFEFQTLVCQLTGMEVANASMYDGASAMAEAILMALRITRRKDAVLAGAIHPEYLEVARTYLRGSGDVLRHVPGGADGLCDRSALRRNLDDNTAAVVVQTPNFYGLIEDLPVLVDLAHEAGAKLIAVVTEPFSLGLIRPPGDFDADIVVGEGQPLGIPMNFGGPGVGLFATRKEFVRQMPGRLVSQTVDREGREGYVLTLATREQHIRRGRATSNICTNQGLCALAVTINLCLLGKMGFRQAAELCHAKAEYAKSEIVRRTGWPLTFSGPTFNEFIIETPVAAAEVVAHCLKHDVLPGLALGRFDPSLSKALLVAVTEARTAGEIDRLAGLLADFKGSG